MLQSIARPLFAGTSIVLLSALSFSLQAADSGKKPCSLSSGTKSSAASREVSHSTPESQCQKRVNDCVNGVVDCKKAISKIREVTQIHTTQLLAFTETLEAHNNSLKNLEKWACEDESTAVLLRIIETLKKAFVRAEQTILELSIKQEDLEKKICFLNSKVDL